MRKTPHLRNLLDQYKTVLKTEEFTSFEAEVERLLQFYTLHLAGFPNAVARGREVQRLIDEQVDASSHIQTTCQKGCGACCHLEVEITSDDAAVLEDSLRSGIVIDFTRLRDLSKRERLDDKWKAGATPSNRCVFLGADNACSNYENRPAVCRKHSVISPVEECEKIGGQPVPKIMPMAEIVMSAAVSQEGVEFAALPKMLQRLIDSRKGHLGNLDFEESKENQSPLPAKVEILEAAAESKEPLETEA